MGFPKDVIVLSVLLGCACAQKPEFWKGTPLDSTVENMRSSCAEKDTIACVQFKAFTFLDTILKKDYLQYFADGVQVSRNGYENEITSRSENSLEDSLETFIKSHDVTFNNLPLVSSIKVDPRSLDDDELNFKVKYGNGNGRQVEARKKSKLKKIFTPILVFVLLKAITLVPLALGILGLKAWNGLQLAFFSFVISTGMAIFQLCQKLAYDSAHAPLVAAPVAWEPAAAQYAARSFDGAAQKMAYSGYYK